MKDERQFPIPVATDEDVAAFIARYATPYAPETDDYHRDPFIADIREGKNDPIYNAHSYHTKVPPRAIIPYILHYRALLLWLKWLLPRTRRRRSSRLCCASRSWTGSNRRPPGRRGWRNWRVIPWRRGPSAGSG